MGITIETQYGVHDFSLSCHTASTTRNSLVALQLKDDYTKGG